ncbi:MAG: M15 family metallopeptidase [Defluviitaleaceae bacterium]|nr:M15 family metallopeptidase [Defluviitaleaceae bacterium]MCL2240891.1 M15 family metallopeptidase [Defluviitaleaceae bacterium]
MTSFILCLVLSLAVPMGVESHLTLVNAEHPLPSYYIPEELATYNGIQLHPAAMEAFTQLLAAMEADGIHGLSLHSAYRSYSRQQSLFSRKASYYKHQGFPPEEAEALAARTVQRPGASEHQTGLALDVSSTGQLAQSFGNTPAGLWLQANAYRFGFIIRYPCSKTHTTYIIYEPWHLRYVGIPHAEIMHIRDLALEEYADFLAAHSPYAFWTATGERFRIYYADTPPKLRYVTTTRMYENWET